MQWSMDAYCLYRRIEQRFEGEIPDELRRSALAGGSNNLAAATARAASRACDELALIAQRQAAVRRTDGPLLGAWRAQGLAWQHRLRAF
jgi:hypothetical protein